MTAKPQKYQLLSFSFSALAKVVLLSPVGLLIFYQLIYMTFFYEYEPNEGHIPPEDFLKAWALFGAIASALLYNAYQGLINLGIGPKWRNSDWQVRKSAAEGNLPETTLLSMAFYDPDERVKEVALSKIADDKLIESYKEIKSGNGSFSNDYVERLLVDRLEKRISDLSQTFEGFKTLSPDEQKIAIQKTDDQELLEAVTLSEELNEDVRKLALSHCGNESIYEKLLAKEDGNLREEAIKNLITTNKSILLDYLPMEKDQRLASHIVRAIDKEAELLECLGPDMTKASASAIIDSINDTECIRLFINEDVIPSWIKEKFKKRLDCLEDKKQKAEQKRAVKKTKAAATGIIGTIKDGRQQRNKRLAAVKELAAQLPACNVTLKEGTFPAWHCPNCSDDGQVIMKPKHFPALERQVKNGAMVSVPPCPQCGIAQSAADVYGGKFDIIMVDISCPHCSQKMSGPIDSWIDCPCHSCGKTVIEV